MIKFEGEHLLPGQIGHFFVILALVSSFISLMAYYNTSRAINQESKIKWEQYGRFLFLIQGISILSIFSIIFYICSHHYYEYMYAYKHASKELEYKYLLACIWEGQEGSFLLWSIWHAVLGSIICFRKKDNEWKAPLMTIVNVAQFFLMLMILGIYFFGVRIGNSPFTLTRNEIPAPIFSQPNYLTFLKDGMGLNVLLRNYWMVIHPPILFLGFASTIIPFGFAYAGLQTKKYGDWIKPALPWALFSTAILGIGIMMGGKWAYESLSFGGYWAWDPVENASLVPWLIMVAGVHTMLIYKSTGHSLKASYWFSILSFIFVLYSTFLTRTGILGDTSVHAFTEAGKAINIMIGIFVLMFAIPIILLYFKHQKNIPVIIKEEETSSREFWMFIGALILFLSSLFIILITSIPVYSKTPLLKDLIIKIHGGPLALPEDPEFLYNKVMILVAIILGLITAFSQYLKYKSTPRSAFIKKIVYPTILSAILTAVLAIVYPYTYYKHGAGFLGAIYTASFCMIYSFIANAMYIRIGLKDKFSHAGGSISHAGFAIMIVGMLISSSNKVVISDSKVNGINIPASIDPMSKKQDNPTENLTLIRQVATKMGEYDVTYLKDSAGNEKGRKFYALEFQSKKNKGNENFILKPDVYLMKDNNMSSNPDTKSFLTKDIFTYISFAINGDNNTDTASFRETTIGEGEKGFYSNGYFLLNKVSKNPNNEKYHFKENDIALMADLTFVSNDSMHYKANPIVIADSFGILQIDDTVYAQNLFVKFVGVSDGRKIKVGIKESKTLIDFITVKSYIFPYINLVWFGLILMSIGIFISIIKKFRLSNTIAITILTIVSTGLIYMFLFAN